VRAALETGYRAFDSAQMYANEAEVGSTILAYLKEHPELKREDIHYTSKLARNVRNYEAVRESIRGSVRACGLGYVDLFLLHSPYGGREARLSSWKAVEDAVKEGEVRIGGVSNWGERHITELLSTNPTLLPAINQIELHPFNPHPTLTACCATHNIVIQSYAPLARAWKLDHPVIVELSRKYACTPAQLMLRWNLQKGNVVLPKSVRRERIEENAAVGGFEIGEGDVRRLEGLDEGLVTDWDPLDAP